MTREEAIEFLNQYIGNDCYIDKCQEAHRMAISALRPITREQVKKMWRGCDFCKIEMDDYPFIVAHNDYSSSDTCYEPTFCPICGKPLTDEAVDILWKRLDEVQDETKTS